MSALVMILFVCSFKSYEPCYLEWLFKLNHKVQIAHEV